MMGGPARAQRGEKNGIDLKRGARAQREKKKGIDLKRGNTKDDGGPLGYGGLARSAESFVTQIHPQ